jgi:hypothetical protein
MKKILLPLFVWVIGSMSLLAQPTITQQPSDQVVTNGGTAVFTIAVSGTGPFTYQWQFNGSNCDLITTVAGNGTNGYSGDGGAAINASLNSASGVATDNAGNFFIVDQNNLCIRKVDTNGIITTVASIPSPYSLTVDNIGNLFVTRMDTGPIEKVDTNGIVTPVAGSGGYGYWGDGGPATSAGLWTPAGVAVDNVGNLFIADAGNNRIRKVDTNGIITTVVGDGLTGFWGDGGPATNAALNYPWGVMVDSAGDLFIADQNNQRIRKMDTNGIITTVAGIGIAGYSGDGGVATNAALKNPSGITVDSAGNLFIADSSNNRIRKVDPNGIISTVAGNGISGFSGHSGPATNVTLAFPTSVTTDKAGNLLIADRNNSRICRMTTTTPTSLPAVTLTLNKVSNNNHGNYSVVISNSVGSVTSSVAALNMPAFIISQPQGLTVAADDSATFNVTAGGTGPYGYQWSFNGTNIDWATNSTLTLTNIQPGQAGAYSLVVSNAFGTVTNSSAVLSVVPLVITNQPQSQSVGVGANVSFSVTVSGQGPFSYQWQFQNVNITGATNSTLVLTNVQPGQSGFYSVIVSNIFGSVTSSNANLTVVEIVVWGNFNYGNSALATVPPRATNVVALAAGDIHCLALRADGTVVAWGANEYNAGETNVPSGLSNVVSIAAGSTHSLALRSDGTLAAWGQIYFQFGVNITVPPAATNVAALALGPGAQHALVLKADGTVLDWGNNNYGLTNIPVTARNVVAVASGATHGVALRADGKVVAWGNVQTSVPSTATNIVAIATSWYGNAALRADGSLLVWGSINFPVSGFTNILDVVCPINAFADNSDVLALRRNGTLVEYSGSVPKYPTNNITAIAAGSYNAFAVVGNGPPIFPGLPVNRTVAAGSRAYFRAVAVGTMPISYQWNANGANISGATNSVLVLTNVQPNLAGNYYSLIASNALGVATNGAMFLNVVPLEVYATTTNLPALAGATVKFSATVIGQGPFGYQWFFNGTNLLGMITNTLSLTNVQLEQAGAYTVAASNSYGSVTSSIVNLAVVPLLITTAPTNKSVITGSSPAFSVVASSLVPLGYQWQFNSTNLSGATTNSLTLTNVQVSQAGLYSVVVSNSYGSVTANATLAVKPFAFTTGGTNLLMTTNGFQLQVNGIFASQSMVIYASTDMISWLPILTNPPATGSVRFLDSAATNWSQRFYRATEQ